MISRLLFIGLLIASLSLTAALQNAIAVEISATASAVTSAITSAVSPAATSATSTAISPLILVLGDSLSAGYGVDSNAGWVDHLKIRLNQNNYPHQVINASVSGETTLGGVNRLPQLLQKHAATIVVIELGGNDGLRGLPLSELKQNLEKAITLSHSQSAKVLLIGMQIPPNFGPIYSKGFQQTFTQLADQQQVALVPFLLKGVGGDPTLMQDDGLHARTEAQVMLLDNVWPKLQMLLE